MLASQHEKRENRNVNKPDMETNNEPKYIVEGSARIFEEGNVFYNPVQEFNRDISILALNTFIEIFKQDLEKRKPPRVKGIKKKDAKVPPLVVDKRVKILEALSATGLRSIRYAKEVEGVDEITANDLMAEAVEMITRNVKNNGVEHLVTPNKADAM